MISITVTGLKEAQSKFRSISRMLKDNAEELFRPLGGELVKNVQDRILSSDDGKWAPGSKWLLAKTAQSKVLKGAEKSVRMRVLKTELRIMGKGGRWTLTQHHEGFDNALTGPDDEFDAHGRVVIKVKDPRVLNLYTEFRKARDGTVSPRAGTFAFVPKRHSKTPARKIWPTDEEVHKITDPMAQRWAKKIIENAK